MVPSSSPVMIHRLNGRFDYICRWWWRRISIYWRLRSEVPILVMMMMTLRSTIGDRVARAFKRSGSRACHGMGLGITMYTYGMGLYRMMMMAWLGGCVDLGLSLGLVSRKLDAVKWWCAHDWIKARSLWQYSSYIFQKHAPRTIVFAFDEFVSINNPIPPRSHFRPKATRITLSLADAERHFPISQFVFLILFSVSSVFHLITVWTPTRCQ